jgi:hypothetical protein
MAEDTNSSSGWGFLIILVLIGWGITSWIGGEREGVVKYDDCRETITLKPDNFQKYYMKFTCNYTKSNSGKIMSGECVHIDTNDSFFSVGSSCVRAYVYQKEPEIKCSDTANGYLGNDDKCYCNSGFKFNDGTRKCEEVKA